ncbi:hypothetical protein BCR36DRAFT_265856, partial [Piromyces finnis]
MIIPTNDYIHLKKQQPLEEILNNIYNQIEIIKNHPHYNSKDVTFELEFRLQNKYTNINVEEFVKYNSCQYFEYLFKENQSTNYRIICNSQYISNNTKNYTGEHIHNINDINNINYDNITNNNNNNNNNNDDETNSFN